MIAAFNFTEHTQIDGQYWKHVFLLWRFFLVVCWSSSRLFTIPIFTDDIIFSSRERHLKKVIFFMFLQQISYKKPLGDFSLIQLECFLNINSIEVTNLIHMVSSTLCKCLERICDDFGCVTAMAWEVVDFYLCWSQLAGRNEACLEPTSFVVEILEAAPGIHAP